MGVEDTKYKPGRLLATIEERSSLTAGGMLCTVLLFLSLLVTAGLYSEAKTVFQQIQAGVAMIAAILLFGLGVAVMRRRTYKVIEMRAEPPAPPTQ